MEKSHWEIYAQTQYDEISLLILISRANSDPGYIVMWVKMIF